MLLAGSMCIASLKINKDSFLLTHNRDENIHRQSSNDLVRATKYQTEFLAPMDLTSKGTWFLSSPKFGGCILNGAFHKHKRNLPYAKSRGNILSEFLAFDSIEEGLELIALKDYECFTAILIDVPNWWFGILVWDEKVKHVQVLDHAQSFTVRSSSTLYSTLDKKNHQKEFLKNNLFTKEELLQKHMSLRMKKNELHKNKETTAICQWEYSTAVNELKYIKNFT